MGELRDEVAKQLEDLCAPGSALHMDSPNASWRAHVIGTDQPYSDRYRADRLRTHGRLMNAFLARETDVQRNGYAAVVTAGPPAAGKTTRLDAQGYDETWRRIDPDVFKEMLIVDDIASGRFTFPSEGLLADGMPLMPLELSGLYHRESVVIADRVREICMREHENIVIEGTLAWAGMADELGRSLTEFGYERLDVLLVEVPEEQAVEQALQRWWAGRTQGTEMGGRFTPEAVIRAMYLDATDTICREHAEALFRAGQTSGMISSLIC